MEIFYWSNLNRTALKVKKVLISQPQPTTGKSPYFDLAEKYGVEFVFKPFIRVDPLSAKEFRQQHVNILDHTAVVFTSRSMRSAAVSVSVSDAKV